MRIYIAGFYNLHGGGTESSQVSINSNPAWVLESYHYMNQLKEQLIRDRKETVFMDSGAFSMFTQGVSISLEKYAEYLEAKKDIIHVASNLDEIGQGREEQTYANQKALEKMGARVQPVHHARDKDEWLQRYLAEGYDYIFLGGMVSETTQYLKVWLDKIWRKYLTNKDGSPKVKVHGFGLTTLELMERYLWFSVDSTAWVTTARYGGIYLDMPNGKVITMKFSSARSPKQKFFEDHYDALSPAAKKAVDARLAEFGFEAANLRVNYGWRHRWNIDFFRRAQDRPKKLFTHEKRFE